MKPIVKSIALTAGPVVLREAMRAIRNRRVIRRTPLGDSRWLTVTVNAPPDDVAGDERVRRALDLPGLRVRITPALGGRGTELAALPPDEATAGRTGPASRIAGEDPRQSVRRALRDAKSLVETGEVLRTEPTRPHTPGGKLIGALARRSGGEGRL
ncbi:hypothetical protein K3N28_09820 [Glycomyces sp. TRM65418]|uniref:hypothetical protein n=1 Tax=Glycomyces sp. TRM65418 TaxID=2867006 RepID=UPI001CE53C4C|nr:hypothetical protein [Glycomyces sp. TRM65418]MCC3763369.1 hypothetical protein [Glycomyces sp. TRM65418]QZD57360.1 hypothetical protein K3N28_09760 [Glycomyces sp. TRM65418]